LPRRTDDTILEFTTHLSFAVSFWFAPNLKAAPPRSIPSFMPVTPTTVESPEPDLAGRRLGDYQLLRRLGRGGMADVYLAEQLSLRRQVALKVLKASLATDDGYVRRFHNEAQAAARLVHANIVQIYEVGCVDGLHYIAQEYVPGQNLTQLLTRLGRGVDVRQAVSILRQVAAALHKASEQGIIHRDIKPENIMISPAGEVKVADFGLARVMQSNEALNLTQIGMTMGTPLYMSPEQVEGKPVDPRSDIYSLGVTCYHMLAGHPPFDADNALAVAVQHLKNDPKRLEVLRPDVPHGLSRIVHRMLAKKPSERFPRAVDLLKELKALQIEGLDDDWAADLPGFSSADIAISTSGRLAATQQLDLVLKSELAQRAQRRSWFASAATAIGLVLLAFAIGAAVAYARRPALLLAPSGGNRPKVEQLASVQYQYAYAQMAMQDQEDAWRAVAEYFPPEKSPENLRYARLAKKGLAAHYLAADRLTEALALYHELAKVERTEADFRLAGIAGEAVVYDKLGQTDELPIRLAELSGARNDLANRIGGFLAREVNTLLEKHRPQGE
jgi:serine/threonine-protein kinase